MASSSVSQDDIDVDFEKNSRRSRIRTARARQINPGGGGVNPASCRLESGNANAALADDDYDAQYAADGGGGDPSGNSAGGGGKYLDVSGDAAGGVGAAANVSAGFEHHDTSPKPVLRTGGAAAKDKRPNKLHHVNKGKQQRDRRKLREKRRSTGVVHLASTESTGGSTTGDDDESSDAAGVLVGGTVGGGGGGGGGAGSVSAETRRNTQHNESPISYNNAGASGGAASGVAAGTGPKPPRGDAHDPDHHRFHHHHHHQKHSTGSAGATSVSGVSHAGVLLPPSVLRSSARSRDKSPSDLEADDENDHDSLNQSGSSSNVSSSTHIPGLLGGSGAGHLSAAGSDHRHSNSNTPLARPVTPTGDAFPEHLERVVEENRRLLSLMEEKDRKIQLLEYKLQQLMKDTRTISEEQSRLQKENGTLLRALSNITAAKQQQ